MNNRTLFTGLALINFFLNERYKRRLVAANFVVMMAFFITLGSYGDARSDDYADYRTGHYMTSVSWVLLVGWVLLIVFGLRHVWHKDRLYSQSSHQTRGRFRSAFRTMRRACGSG